METAADKIKTFVPWSEIEEGARQQILNVSQLPFIFKWVAVMPDCHYGIGATVGTVIATRGAVVPSAVGVDIGCGMIALQTSLKRDDLKDLHSIRQGIERRIPMSAGKNNARVGETAVRRIGELKQLEKDTGGNYTGFDSDWELALGTLGGGNHFIEVCTDENDTVWLTVHSGSRGVGNKIGMHYIRLAQKKCQEASISLPHRDLAYLTENTREFDNYIRDLKWAQAFARFNRDEMMDRMLTEMSYQIFGKDGRQKELEVSRINCHHNFTQVEKHFGRDVWVTRKGAIQARLGMRGMIPGSMGARSYIVSGLENENSFHSAPHGAGRRMSRTKAKAAFSMQDMERAMSGIEFRKSSVLLDEIPSAYKDIDQVMRYSADLVKIEHTLKQFVNCKGD
jgi:tRNA-splicing ligase RtcB (3'-phosphate/5'-hydroxy nucleic acid ligase)